jgi:hypothetical protein
MDAVFDILLGKKPIRKQYQYLKLGVKSQPIHPKTVPMAWRTMVILTHSDGNTFVFIPQTKDGEPPSKDYLEYCLEKMARVLNGFKEHKHPLNRIMAKYSRKVIDRIFKKGTITDLEQYLHTEQGGVLPLAIILASGKKNDPEIFLIVMRAMGLTIPVSGLKAAFDEKDWDSTIPRRF